MCHTQKPHCPGCSKKDFPFRQDYHFLLESFTAVNLYSPGTIYSPWFCFTMPDYPCIITVQCTRIQEGNTTDHLSPPPCKTMARQVFRLGIFWEKIKFPLSSSGLLKVKDPFCHRLKLSQNID